MQSSIGMGMTVYSMGPKRFIVLGERHLRSVLSEYVRYFNTMRPHQGLDQRIPISKPQRIYAGAGRVFAMPVPGGLHHNYRVAA